MKNKRTKRKFEYNKYVRFLTLINILYQLGDYIATIEHKVINAGNNQTFCRVYTNWPKCENTKSNDKKHATGNNIDPMSFNVTIRARIAGRVTPSSNSNCLEVIEIPMSGKFEFIVTI